MKTMLFSLYLVLAGLAAMGQNSGTRDEKPGVTESPCLTDAWYTGTIRTLSGKIFDAVKVRFDCFKDELEFQEGDSTLRLGKEVKEFSFLTGSDLYNFRKGFPAVDQQTQNSFYRILYDGNLKVLKRYNAQTQKTTSLSGNSTTGKVEALYILKDNRMIPIRTNDRKGIMQIMADKKNHMEYAAKEQQIDFSQEGDIVRLIEEYDAYKAGGSN